MIVPIYFHNVDIPSSDFPSGYAWPRLLLLAQLFQCHSLASGATGQRCAVVMAGRDLWK